ncbi:MAG: hypothetical protein ACRDHX_09495 [Chloroflexota bacterium]
MLETKLLAGKVTYVHHRLWPDIFGVGLPREGWQLDALSPESSWLLECLARDSELQLNDLPLPAGLSRKRLPDAGRQIERRVLARGYSIHTPGGAHAKCLETWQRWGERTGVQPAPVSEAKRQLEQAAEAFAAGAAAQLPWMPSGKGHSHNPLAVSG